MRSLKELHASFSSGIGDRCIKGLKLVKLNARHNLKIKNISFMTTLRVLEASYNSGIADNDIRTLKLIKLNAPYAQG